MKNASDVLKMMKDKEVKFVDLRFTDTKGKMQHVTADVSVRRRGVFADGYAFDGSSIAGWKGIEASDMMLMPDPARRISIRSSRRRPSRMFCDVLEPSTGQPYERDPRGIAKKAEAYMKSTGVGDNVVFGPEAEFFIFDDVRFSDRSLQHSASSSTAAELPSNTGTEYEMGNLGHRPRTKGGYFPVPPVDSCPGHPLRDALGDGRDGRRRREAPPRGGLRPARARHQVRPDGHDGRPHADLQIRRSTTSRRPTARPHASCPSPSSATTARACTCHQSIWKGGSRCSPATSTPTCRRPASTTSAASSSTPRPSTPSPTRPPTPTSGWCRATRRPCCSPTRRATARRRAASRS